MKIIPYQECYNNKVISLILPIQNKEYDLNLSIDEQPELKNIGKTILFNGGRFWIALDNNEVIGTIALLRVSENGGILKKFFVSEEYRGEKVGLQLYTALMAFCKDYHIQILCLIRHQ